MMINTVTIPTPKYKFSYLESSSSARAWQITVENRIAKIKTVANFIFPVFSLYLFLVIFKFWTDGYSICIFDVNYV